MQPPLDVGRVRRRRGSHPRPSQRRIYDPRAECLAPDLRIRTHTERLPDVLERARRVSPFYRDKLAGLDPHGDLRDVPFTTRDELVDDQRLAPPFGRFHGVTVTEAAAIGRSGTGFSATGRRLNVLSTTDDIVRQGRLLARAFWEAGVRPAQRVYLADDPRYNLLAVYAMQATAILGAIIVYTGAERSERTARYVVPVLPPEHVFLTPTYAQFLPSVVLEKSARRWPIRSLSGWGEPGYSMDRTRARLRALWSAVTACPEIALVDVYALAEAGVVAIGCREGTGVHLCEDVVLVELVDPDSDRIVETGERGEVVITLLDPVAVTLIRYRTGDVARLDDTSCACGRTGRRLRDLQRLSDRVRVGDRAVYPLDVEQALDATKLRVANYLVVRRAAGTPELHLRVTGLEGATGADEAAGRLERFLGVPIVVDIEPSAELPPFLHKTMKVIDAGQDGPYRAELAFQRELEHV